MRKRNLVILAGLASLTVIVGLGTFRHEIECRYYLYRFRREPEYFKEVKREYPWFWSKGKAKAFYTYTDNEEAYGRWLNGWENNWHSSKTKKNRPGP